MKRRDFIHVSAGVLSLAGIAQGSFPVDPLSAEGPAIFPKPQVMHRGERRIPLVSGEKLNVSIVVDPDAGRWGLSAGRLIAEELKRRTGQQVAVSSSPSGSGFQIRISPFGASHGGKETQAEGGYWLRISSGRADLQSRGVGLRYAAATFVQLLEGWKTPQLQEVEIHDWPEFPRRGIFNETLGVSALMTLQDWKGLIDFAAFFKLNTLNIALYNCWNRSLARGGPQEYFFFPSHHYPQLKTPLHWTFYSPAEGREIEKETLPLMYQHDFLGEIIAYGKERGVEVSAYFSSLGHNTLIPRLMPEVSMKDADCKPIGYGFCTTCPKTYEVLFNLYDEIIDRYLAPNNITTFHVAMDEVSHVCQCSDCRVAWRGENNFYVNHLLKIARHLKEKGMTRVLVWHDMLHRAGLINRELEARLDKEGLTGLITLAWWCYSRPPKEGELFAYGSFARGLFCPPTRITAWAVPSPGWDFSAPLGFSYRSQNSALLWLLRLAQKSGAQGTLSYSAYDPFFQQGLLNFAQYSWNQAPSLSETHKEYARWLFGSDAQQGHRVLQLYANASQLWLGSISSFYSIHRARSVGQVLTPSFKESDFTSSIENLEEARRAFVNLHAQSVDPEKAQTIDLYRVEARRLAAFLHMCYLVLKTNVAYDQFRETRSATSLSALERSIKNLDQSLEEHAGCMRDLEESRYPASTPDILQFETRAHQGVELFRGLFAELAGRAHRGETEYLPEVVVPEDELFAANLGMRLPQ